MRGLFPFGRQTTPEGDLDAHLAGVQLGLDEKRNHWLAFLLDKLEDQRAQVLTQAVDMPGHNVAADPPEDPQL
jgi:hypothetical protein